MTAMTIACLTGGAATGKSEFIRLFVAGRSDVVVFDCDAAVHKLLEIKEMQEQIAAEFGAAVIDPQGGVDRGALRPG